MLQSDELGCDSDSSFKQVPGDLSSRRDHIPHALSKPFEKAEVDSPSKPPLIDLSQMRTHRRICEADAHRPQVRRMVQLPFVRPAAFVLVSLAPRGVCPRALAEQLAALGGDLPHQLLTDIVAAGAPGGVVPTGRVAPTGGVAPTGRVAPTASGLRREGRQEGRVGVGEGVRRVCL